MQTWKNQGIEALHFQNRFVAELPGDPIAENRCRQVSKACYSHTTPTAVCSPTLLALVPEVAELINLSTSETPVLTEVLSGNRVLTPMTPYAACYGGHQFGNWAGQLGDGRAITLAEVVNEHDESFELQLKGAGVTPYSRRGDGRAVLRSSLREFVSSEAMHHLGIPTTRALSLVATGERVERDLFYDGNAKLEPGAIVCRVAQSFLRFGSYEIHAARGDVDTLRKLTTFTLRHFFPKFIDGDICDVPAFLEEVSRRTARLVVEWMRVGFVHGVMNTDNMSILGLTIDYGPFGWVEDFDLNFTPNTTDASGRRYRFGNQPSIGYWNIAQLGRALAPLVDDVAQVERAVDRYKREVETAYVQMLLGKLGLTRRDDCVDDDETLLGGLFSFLTTCQSDMTLFFRHLANCQLSEPLSCDEVLATFNETFYDSGASSTKNHSELQAWVSHYRERVRIENVSDLERKARMDKVNPLYVPRNYLIHQVIEKTVTAEGAWDRAPLAELLEVLRRPYDVQPGKEAFAAKRPEWARHKAGCSMLSCSS